MRRFNRGDIVAWGGTEPPYDSGTARVVGWSFWDGTAYYALRDADIPWGVFVRPDEWLSPVPIFIDPAMA